MTKLVDSCKEKDTRRITIVKIYSLFNGKHFIKAPSALRHC
jgi:hypothetical protein